MTLHDRSLEDVNLSGAWLTIGSFDGVHRGHQAIIQRPVKDAHAAGDPAVVLTFHPHPAMVLRNRQEPFYLSTPEERAELLGVLGIDRVVTEPFNLQIAGLTAREFMGRVHRSLQPRHILVGYDFALGRGREGNVERLKELGQEFKYTLDVLQPIQQDGEIISSSQVRAALAEGLVQKAMRLLGRPYQVSGATIHGDGRGRKLGIPTVNLDIWPWKALPKAGVYACRVKIAGQPWNAVTNIGVRPTFENQLVPARVEAHILDFERDLYGEILQLEFIERLRDEMKFPAVEALLAQIQRDIQQAKEIL